MVSKKYVASIGIVILVIALGILAWQWFAPDMFSPGGEESRTYVEGEVRKEVILEEADQYTIDVDYPQFGIEKIDEQVVQGVNFLIDEFKTEAQNAPEGVRYELLSIFDGAYVDEKIVSARLSVSSYTGGAHPVTTIYGLNFDRVTEKELTLSDALKLINATLAQVAESATNQLSEGLGESFFKEGAEANVDNYSTFSISKDAVTFIFDEYQVAPYAAGPQGVSFARENL
jgi:hypothetical protein